MWSKITKWASSLFKKEQTSEIKNAELLIEDVPEANIESTEIEDNKPQIEVSPEIELEPINEEETQIEVSPEIELEPINEEESSAVTENIVSNKQTSGRKYRSSPTYR